VQKTFLKTHPVLAAQCITRAQFTLIFSFQHFLRGYDTEICFFFGLNISFISKILLTEHLCIKENAGG